MNNDFLSYLNIGSHFSQCTAAFGGNCACIQRRRWSGATLHVAHARDQEPGTSDRRAIDDIHMI